MSPPRDAHAAAAISVDPAELERAAIALTRVAAGLSEAREALVRSWLLGAAGLNGTATAAALAACAQRASAACAAHAELVAGHARALAAAARRYRADETAAVPIQRVPALSAGSGRG